METETLRSGIICFRWLMKIFGQSFLTLASRERWAMLGRGIGTTKSGRQRNQVRLRKELCIIVLQTITRGKFEWGGRLGKVQGLEYQAMSMGFILKHLDCCCHQLLYGLIIGRTELIRIINQIIHQWFLLFFSIIRALCTPYKHFWKMPKNRKKKNWNRKKKNWPLSHFPKQLLCTVRPISFQSFFFPLNKMVTFILRVIVSGKESICNEGDMGFDPWV